MKNRWILKFPVPQLAPLRYASETLRRSFFPRPQSPCIIFSESLQPRTIHAAFTTSPTPVPPNNESSAVPVPSPDSPPSASASSSLPPSVPTADSSENLPEPIKRPSYQITFTCKPCEERSSHEISKHGYHYGTVLITCPGCKNRHVISDHLKIFADLSFTIEDIMRDKGELVKKGSINSNGDIEFWEKEGTVPD